MSAVQQSPGAGVAGGRLRATGSHAAGMGWGERYVHYWLVLPAVLCMVAVLLYPMLYSLWVSLLDWKLGAAEQTFIGIRNYTDAFTSIFFQTVLIQNVIYAIACVVVDFVVGMALALLLNQKFRGRGFLRTLLLLPMLTAPVLAGFNFRWIFNDRFGLANQIILWLGLGSPLPWLAEPNAARITIVLATVWQGIPFFMLLLLAGLQALPTTPFEAAVVDGASAWQRFRYITLPLLRPVIVVAAALQLIDLFRAFDVIYIMTFGGPGHATELFPFYTYRAAFSENRLGFACALSWITLMISLVLLIPLFLREGSGAEGEKAKR